MNLPLRQPPGVLARIVARKHEDVAARRAAAPISRLAVQHAPPPRGFEASLRAKAGVALIAEIKPRSPSTGARNLTAAISTAELVGRARVYGRYAGAISVLCDGPYFGGSLELLRAVRAAVDVPVLCKDFIVTAYQVHEARAAGADAVLLMAALLPPETLRALLDLVRALGMQALVEAHTEAEIDEALGAGAAVVGVNARDLTTLDIDLQRGRELLARVPDTVVRVAESGLHSAADVQAVADLADAALVGTALMGTDAPAARIEALGWKRCA